jgi:tRNA pseudouridine55 synthase
MQQIKHLSNINPLQDVVLVNKPLGWTSFQVVNKLRFGITKYHMETLKANNVGKKKIKVGHAGTLDPLATGLLIICIGKETKNIDQYMASEKEYSGSICLGANTPSYDKETEINETFDISNITIEMIAATAKSFIGEQLQMPPIFSAIKKDGQRAYDAARKGQEIVLTHRSITIYNFEITAIDLPLVYFKINCSKGTYIRSIAFDFGKKLNNGGYLNSLCRTASGIYNLQNAVTIEEFLDKNEL